MKITSNKNILKMIKSIGGILLALTLALSPLAQSRSIAAGPPKGIDVSVYQGNINWQAVAADGVSFAFVRLGTTKKGIDGQFSNNMKNAVAAGVRTGVYIYSYATSVEGAAAEANIVLQNIQGYTVSFPVVIDLEDATLSGLSPDTLAAMANTFCGIIKSAGYYPMVYANKNWFTNKIGPIGYDKWVAQYAPVCTYPNPTIWQATNTGRVNGVPANVDINYLYKDLASIIIPEGFVQREGKTYYYSNYRMKTGWADINGGRYFFQSDGSMLTGWITNGALSLYFQPNGLLQTGWADLNGHRYYFNEQGQMQRGLIQIGAAKYFFDNNGYMHTGWFDAGTAKFYFRPDGSMVTGWADLDGHRYYFSETGQAAVGLKQIGNTVYLFNADGTMQAGWFGNEPSKYYFLADGSMAKGWQNIDGAAYYFKENGQMNIGLLILNNVKYYNDVDGKLVTGWKQIGDKWFLFAPDGVLVANTTIDVNGVVCQFDANGVLIAPAGYIPLQ